MDNSLEKIKNNINTGLNKVGNMVQTGTDQVSNFMSHSVKSIYDSSVSTANKTGLSSIFDKIKNHKSFDEMDLTNVVIMLIAIITIIVVVFFLPRFNKSTTFEKKLFNSTFFKFIICLFLFYAFYHYDIPLFCMCLIIVFIFFWFYHGCFTEHMITEEISKELNKKPAIIVKLEGGEIVIDDVDKFRQMIIADKIDEIKQLALNEVKQENSFTDKVKSTASSIIDTTSNAVSSVASTTSNVLSTVASPITNLLKNDSESEVIENEITENQPTEIFDQRDFMIMPEDAPERTGTFNRICDYTRCTKPTSFVEPINA